MHVQNIQSRTEGFVFLINWHFLSSLTDGSYIQERFIATQVQCAMLLAPMYENCPKLRTASEISEGIDFFFQMGPIYLKHFGPGRPYITTRRTFITRMRDHV